MFESLHALAGVSFVYVGLGGGFNERENVEYKDRDSSDEEYDEVCIPSVVHAESITLYAWSTSMYVRIYIV